MEKINFKGIIRNASETQHAPGACESITNLRYENGEWRPIGKHNDRLPHSGGVPGEPQDEWYLPNQKLIVTRLDRQVFFSGDAISTSYHTHVITLPDDEYAKNVLELNKTIIIITNKRTLYYILKDGILVKNDIDYFELSFLVVDTDAFGGDNHSDRKTSHYRKGTGTGDYFNGILFLCHALVLWDGSVIRPSKLSCVLEKGIKWYSTDSDGVQWFSNDYNKIRYGLAFPLDETLNINELISSGFIKHVAIYAAHFDAISGTTEHHEGYIIGKNYEFSTRDRKIQEMAQSIRQMYKIAELGKLPGDISGNTINYLTFDLTDLETREILEIGNSWSEFTGNVSGLHNNRLYLMDVVEKPFKTLFPMFNGGKKNTGTYEWAMAVQFEVEGESETFFISERFYSDSDIMISNLVSLPIFEGLKNISPALFVKNKGTGKWHTAMIAGMNGTSGIEFTTYMYINCKTNSKIGFATEMISEFGKANNIDDAFMIKRYSGNQRIAYYPDMYLLVSPVISIEHGAQVSDPFLDNKNYLTEDINRAQFSELNNALIFPPEFSYRVGNRRIFDAAGQIQELSPGQFGQFPFTVFNEDGIYSLEHQSTDTLFSTVNAISYEIAARPNIAISTNIGVVFLTDKDVKVLLGKEVRNLSESIQLQPSTRIQQNADYRLFTGQETSHAYNSMFPELSQLIPDVAFSEYIKNAVLGYAYLNNREEIIVSNPNYSYSYIYNIKNSYWYMAGFSYKKYLKIYPQLAGFGNPNGYYASYILDNEFDTLTPIMIETKPINSDQFLMNYRRIALRCMKGLGAKTKAMTFSIFASNDTTRWQMVDVAQIAYNHTDEKKDIYLGRGRSSFKFYKIVITGMLNSSDSISHIDIDLDAHTQIPLK